MQISSLCCSVSKHLLAIIECLLPVTLNKHIILTRTSNREGVCTATDPGLPLDPGQPHLTLSGVQIRDWKSYAMPCGPDSNTHTHTFGFSRNLENHTKQVKRLVFLKTTANVHHVFKKTKRVLQSNANRNLYKILNRFNTCDIMYKSE